MIKRLLPKDGTFPPSFESFDLLLYAPGMLFLLAPSFCGRVGTGGTANSGKYFCTAALPKSLEPENLVS